MDIQDKVTESLSRKVSNLVSSAFSITEDTAESPIEQAMAAAIAVVWMMENVRFGLPSDLLVRPSYVDLPPILPPADGFAWLVPQYEANGYRYDLALFCPGYKVLFIECDGHDFHERTKEQALRDRRRDRRSQQDGNRVVRFTGAEIWADAASCASEALNLFVTAEMWVR